MIEINKPFFFWFLLAIGITAIFAGGQFFYLMFYLLIFFILIPLLWLRFALNKIEGNIEVSAVYGEVGKTVEVSYYIINSPFGFFPYLELSNMVSESFTSPAEGRHIALAAGYEALFKRSVKCIRRGVYGLDTFRVKTGDPFGIFKLSRSLSSGKEIKIYPLVKKTPGVTLPARQHFGNIKVKDHQFENYTHVAYLRDWRDGDNAKRIHWKQSAKQGSLVVKNFELTGNASLNIFIDMSSRSYRTDKGYALEDLAVETAASIIYFSLQERIPVKVFAETLSSGILSGSQMSDYRAIMDNLIAVSPTGNSSFASYVNRYSFYITSKSSIYILTPSLGIEEATTFLHLKQKGFYPVIFKLEQGSEHRLKNKLLDKLNQNGLETTVIYTMEDKANAIEMA